MWSSAKFKAFMTRLLILMRLDNDDIKWLTNFKDAARPWIINITQYVARWWLIDNNNIVINKKWEGTWTKILPWSSVKMSCHVSGDEFAQEWKHKSSQRVTVQCSDLSHEKLNNISFKCVNKNTNKFLQSFLIKKESLLSLEKSKQ